MAPWWVMTDDLWGEIENEIGIVRILRVIERPVASRFSVLNALCARAHAPRGNVSAHQLVRRVSLEHLRVGLRLGTARGVLVGSGSAADRAVAAGRHWPLGASASRLKARLVAGPSDADASDGRTARPLASVFLKWVKYCTVSYIHLYEYSPLQYRVLNLIRSRSSEREYCRAYSTVQ